MAKKNKSIVGAIILTALNITTLNAQKNVCVAGGDVYGSGSISFTIGQSFYVESKSANGCILPGVQQTSYIVTEVETAVSEISPSIKAKVYPNPAVDNLTLDIENKFGDDIHYVIIDNNGRNIYKSDVKSSTTDIDMRHFAPSVYFLQVFVGAKRLQVFKIVKIK